jgi:hypothetical protein
MDLRDFVTESLLHIQEGVQNAIKRRHADSTAVGAINPVWGDRPDRNWADYTQGVEFDVAVTVGDKTSGEGKGAIKIFSVGEVGAGMSKVADHTTVSRIKFSVPIVPPASNVNSKI